MARVYLETSFISSCVSTRTSVRARYEREISLRWLGEEGPKNELFVSDPVIAELSAPNYRSRDAALSLAYGFRRERVTPEMVALAKILADRFVMPRDLLGDALHFAVAVYVPADLLLTWNVKHLANTQKRRHLDAVCSEIGLSAPRIVRPDVLLDEVS